MRLAACSESRELGTKPLETLVRRRGDWRVRRWWLMEMSSLLKANPVKAVGGLGAGKVRGLVALQHPPKTCVTQ